jgi:signal peptidase
MLASVARKLALLAGAAVVALLLLPPLLGMHRYVITGRSMTGTIPKGSLAFDESVPVSALRRGDVITYQPPSGASSDAYVTHRIVWIGRDRAGRRVFRTRGDANPVADPWRFTLPAATQPRVAFHVPYAGYALAALSLRPVRMLLIGLPALLIACFAIASLWREPAPETNS